ncbi:hypothetical protein A2U01_0109408, partial [Trifolium medium]|nr:hypothetical protein [Trifolium medium]
MNGEGARSSETVKVSSIVLGCETVK